MNNLSSVEIPATVKQIGECAFQYCSVLKTITIPSSIKVIGIDAFLGCASLEEVYYYGTEEQWNIITIFDDNSSLTLSNIHYNCCPNIAEKVINKTKDAVIGFENGDKTAVIACQSACVVLVKTTENSYIRKTATKRSEGVYEFDLSDVPNDVELVVSLKGDANMDGYINSTDLGQARGVMSQKLVPSDLQMLVMDLKADGIYNSTDLGQLRAMMSGKLELNW